MLCVCVGDVMDVVRSASPRGPMCLIFNLSGPCELLFLLFL